MHMTMQRRPVEQLQQDACLESSTTIRFQTISFEKAIQKIEMLKINAKNSKKDEERYMLLYRAVSLCDILHKRDDLKYSKNSAYYYHIKELFATILKDLELLDSILSKNDIRPNPVPTKPVEIVKQKERTVEDAIAQPENHFVTPRQLVQYVEDMKKMVLIIDYRANPSPSVEYKDTNFIKVVWIDLNALKPGLVGGTLHMHVDIKYRYSISHVSDFDMVVLMGDNLNHGSPFSPASPSKVLYEALTLYNPLYPLKLHPFFLQGGFEAWNYAYPIYVTKMERRNSYEPNPDFSELVARAKASLSATVSSIQYPDLFKKHTINESRFSPDYISQSTFPAKLQAETEYDISADFNNMMSEKRAGDVVYDRRPTPTRSPVIRDVPIKVEKPSVKPRSERADSTVKSSVSSHSLNSNSTQYSTDRPTSYETSQPPKPKPLVDRSNKPHVDSVTEFPVHPAETCAKTAFVDQITGGARVDTSLPYKPIAQKPLPPTPDRTTKIAYKAEEETNALRILYEMSLPDYNQTKGKNNPVPGTGLENIGNTCFMSTALQALFNTPALRSIFTEKSFIRNVNTSNKFGTKGVITACFSALMDAIWSGEFSSIRPQKFYDLFGNFNPDMANGKQHDAQEFLMCLLTYLHEDTNRVKEKTNFTQDYDGRNIVQSAKDYASKALLFDNSPIKDIFYMMMASMLQCTSCRTASLTFEDSSQVTLELPTSNCQLTTCLNQHFMDTILDGPSKWNCPKCKQPQVTRKSSKLWQLPPFLIIHMKRFKILNNRLEKNKINVDFDVNLDLADYLHFSAPAQKTRYQLYAISNHYGELTGGHYTSLVYNEHKGSWVKFDDSYVTEVGLNKIKSPEAFLLYYRRL